MLKSIRFLLLGFIFSFSCLAGAAQARLSCTQSTSKDLLDTFYLLSETENGYRLTVQYGEGAQPLESDPSTTVRVRDLKELPIRAELFERLPQKFTLEFSEENCNLESKNSHLDWHCFTQKPGKLGELSYKSLSFFVYSQEIESAFGKSEWINVGLEFSLSLDDFLGEKRLKELLARSSEEELREIQFRRKYETLLRAAVVSFENVEGASPSCYIPDFSSKGILDQL